MRTSFCSLLVLSYLLVFAGCQYPGNAPQPSVNRPKPTPTFTPTSTTPSAPRPTPGPLPNCPQPPDAAPGPAPSAPLSMYVWIRDGNSIYADLAALNASDGRQRWRKQSVLPGDGSTLVVVDQNVVYTVIFLDASKGGYVEALNASDGKLRWCMPAVHPVSPLEGFAYPRLAVDAGTVYVSDGFFGFVTAFNASDGKQLWQAQPGGVILSLIAASGQVYVSSTEKVEYPSPHTFWAFDARNGKERWHMPMGNADFPPPSIANGVVYVTRTELDNPEVPSTLYALNASDGSERWHRITPNPGDTFRTATVVDGVIYVLDASGPYALDASDGSLLWHQQRPIAVYMWLAPVVADGVLYIGSAVDPEGQGIVYGFDTSNGKQVWQSQLIPRGPRQESEALLQGAPLDPNLEPVLFLSASDGVIYASTPFACATIKASTGNILWSEPDRALAVG